MDGGPSPVITSSDDRTRTWLVLAGGALATIAAVVALVQLWPEDGSDDALATATSTPATTAPATTAGTGPGSGEPSAQSSTTTAAAPPSADLFHGGLPVALAALRSAAGDPTEVIEITIYESYVFLAYRDPANPGNIDRRLWRDGKVGDPEPNPINDRVDADTTPSLFSPDELDDARLAALIEDAPSHYDLPTVVSHVIVDRFLPFDERVLIRVYATPADGRSGGGYVSYDTAGRLVDVCC